MTDDLNCGKCGAVLKVEKEYVTFKDGKAAYIRCSNADCNNSSRIAWDKVKHLKEDSIKPVNKLEDEQKEVSVKPLIEVNKKDDVSVEPALKVEDIYKESGNPVDNYDNKIDNLKTEIEFLKTDMAKLISKDADEIESLRKYIEVEMAEMQKLSERIEVIESSQKKKKEVEVPMKWSHRKRKMVPVQSYDENSF